MVRRRSPPPADISIPEGWSRHDGGGIPVHRHSRPAVMFRSGSQMRIGTFPAKHWADFSEDCWAWSGRPEDRFDIVAYLEEEDEFISVGRLS